MSFRRSNLLKAGLLSFTMLVPATSHALVIEHENSSLDLANALVLNLPGITITGSQLFGQVNQAGIFTNVVGTYGLPQDGIAFSTGDVSQYGTANATDIGNTTFAGGTTGGGGGPIGECTDEDECDFEVDVALAAFSTTAASTGATDDIVIPEFNNATPSQEALLDPITSNPGETNSFDHNDVVQLNIQFDAEDDVEMVTFFGAFGSEEYPEFVDDSFIDGFGLYVNGINYANVTEFNGSTPLPVNIRHPSFEPLPGTKLDGVLAPAQNPVLRFDVPVNAGEENEFVIILADTSDAIYDTTVYLSSFIAANPGGGNDGPTPATGATEFDPLLPITDENGNPVFDENGGFIIDIAAEIADQGQLIWVDPPVAIGYTYEVAGGALITSVTAPSLATVDDVSGYQITDGVTTVNIAAGQTIDLLTAFGAGTAFLEVSGIDPLTTVVDSEDPTAFPFGLIFAGVTNDFQVTVTPVTDTVVGPTPVPLPATGLLLGAALLGGGLMRRRQKAT